MTMTIVFSILGLILGGIIAWLIASSKAGSIEAVNSELRQQIQQKNSEINEIRNELESERQSRVEAITKLDASQKSLEEQKALIEAMKKEMTDTFNALSSAALKSSSEDFLRLASEHLGRVAADTKGNLGEHQAKIDGVIKPLHEALKRYEYQIKAMEESRHKAYGGLEEQLRTLTLTHENLQKETSNLVSALRKPQVRGRWGEMQLKRVAELSGMSMYCDFTEQKSIDTEKGRIRPDMIVHLPMEREIVVDSKVSLEAYLDAIAAGTDEERKSKMERHAQQLRSHMNKLASKEYWSQFNKSPEFVILFIPGESFFSSALEIDNTLIEDGIQKKVIIATPITFIALLRAIAYGWRQEQVAKNAQMISELGKQVYERMNILVQHLSGIGISLEKAVDSYNKAVGSVESRVMPSVRRFKELGAAGGDEIPPLEQIDHAPKNLNFIELNSDGTVATNLRHKME